MVSGMVTRHDARLLGRYTESLPTLQDIAFVREVIDRVLSELVSNRAYQRCSLNRPRRKSPARRDRPERSPRDAGRTSCRGVRIVAPPSKAAPEVIMARYAAAVRPRPRRDRRPGTPAARRRIRQGPLPRRSPMLPALAGRPHPGEGAARPRRRGPADRAPAGQGAAGSPSDDPSLSVWGRRKAGVVSAGRAPARRRWSPPWRSTRGR